MQIDFSGHFDPIFHKAKGFCISPFLGIGGAGSSGFRSFADSWSWTLVHSYHQTLFS